MLWPFCFIILMQKSILNLLYSLLAVPTSSLTLSLFSYLQKDLQTVMKHSHAYRNSPIVKRRRKIHFINLTSLFHSPEIKTKWKSNLAGITQAIKLHSKCSRKPENTSPLCSCCLHTSSEVPSFSNTKRPLNIPCTWHQPPLTLDFTC